MSMQILENFNLKHFNTFHVSAHARYFVAVSSIDELREALRFRQQHQLSYMLIGQGSNLLFKQDFPGLVIELDIKGIEVVQETAEHVFVEVACGEIWHDFVMYCLDHDWFGLENLSLIPGTVGAAPVQNIGAYGVELADVLYSVHAMEIASGDSVDFSNDECEFDYRDSVFKNRLKDRYIICSVVFRLGRKADINLAYPSLAQALAHLPPEDITPRLVSETVCRIRASKLPDPGVLGNAGSFFWNPVLEKTDFDALKQRYPDIVGYPTTGSRVKVPAAWLIEKAGWKGYREGDVGVHSEHALVLVNHGSASGAALVALSEKIQHSVRDLFGIQLWPEVRIV